MNTFQESLNELLLEGKLNRKQLASKVGVTHTTINGFFNLNYYPTIELAIRLSDYFNCSLDYLLGLSDVKNKEYTIDTNSMLKNFNDNLAEILKNNNISNAKAMRDMQMGEFTFYRWKRGMFPKTISLINVAKYLGISIDYLLGHECK